MTVLIHGYRYSNRYFSDFSIWVREHDCSARSTTRVYACYPFYRYIVIAVCSIISLGYMYIESDFVKISVAVFSCEYCGTDSPVLEGLLDVFDIIVSPTRQIRVRND